MKLKRSNVVAPNADALPNESDRAPPYVRPLSAMMLTPSYCVPRAAPLISKTDVLEPPRTTDATVSTPGLLPGDRMPFTVMAPPIVPEPPILAPAATVTAPFAAD